MAGKGKVLLMDDEQTIVDMTLQVLGVLDYEGMSARDGAAALGLYKQEKEAGVPFDLVILDLSVRKGIGGAETIVMLKSYDPTVKAIVSSGHTDNKVVENYRKYGFSGRLTKPYSISDLQDILERMIIRS